MERSCELNINKLRYSNKGGIMNDQKIYLKISEISKFYNIPLRTIYARIKAGYYETNSAGKVCTNDVEKYIVEPIKLGRKFKK